MWQVWVWSSLTCQLVLFTKMICWGTDQPAGASWLCRLHRGGARTRGTQRTSPRQQSYGFGLFQSCVINSGATFTDRATIHHFQLLIQAEVEESIHCYTTMSSLCSGKTLQACKLYRLVCTWSFPRICIIQASSYCLKNHPEQSHTAARGSQLLQVHSRAHGCSLPSLHHLQTLNSVVFGSFCGLTEFHRHPPRPQGPKGDLGQHLN